MGLPKALERKKERAGEGEATAQLMTAIVGTYKCTCVCVCSNI